MDTRVILMPEAGEGRKLLFRNRDMLSLQVAFGDSWFEEAFGRLNRFDMKFIEKCLEVGGAKVSKGGGGDERLPIKLEEIEAMNMAALTERICDALYLATFGRKFQEHLTYVQQKLAEEGGESGNPPLSPGSSSAVSGETLSGPG